MEAITLRNTLTQTIVLCPYCNKKHKHGKIMKPEHRSSHCNKGDYLIKPKSSFVINNTIRQ